MGDLVAYTPLLLSGAWLTFQVAMLSLFFATITGLVTAFARMSRYRALSAPATVYTTLVRGIPDLVLMLLIFFGGQNLVNLITDFYGWDYFELSAFFIGICSLTFIYGPFFAENFRGAMLQIDKRQFEGAQALGLSKLQTWRLVILPQFLTFALPGYSNTWLVLLKGTALLSLIGLSDIMFLAKAASRTTHHYFMFFFAVSLYYLLLTAASDWIFRRYRRKYAHLFSH